MHENQHSAVADLHSKIFDACSPRGPNSFNIMQFLGKFWQNRILAPLPPGLAPPPGSATAVGLGFGGGVGDLPPTF